MHDVTFSLDAVWHTYISVLDGCIDLATLSALMMVLLQCTLKRVPTLRAIPLAVLNIGVAF